MEEAHHTIGTHQQNIWPRDTQEKKYRDQQKQCRAWYTKTPAHRLLETNNCSKWNGDVYYTTALIQSIDSTEMWNLNVCLLIFLTNIIFIVPRMHNNHPKIWSMRIVLHKVSQMELEMDQHQQYVLVCAVCIAYVNENPIQIQTENKGKWKMWFTCCSRCTRDKWSLPLMILSCGGFRRSRSL